MVSKNLNLHENVPIEYVVVNEWRKRRTKKLMADQHMGLLEFREHIPPFV